MNHTLDLTIIIKTFERQHSIKRLYDSIRIFYPDIPIIIADDSRTPLESLGDANIIQLPFNVGLSKGRNVLINHVQTKYFLLLDDDFLFTKSTDLYIPYKILEEDVFDIVSIELKDFGWKNRINRGIYYIKDSVLWLNQLEHDRMLNGHPKYDFILNCFMGKTEVVKNHPWDDSIKIGHEHDDFFLTFKEKGINITHVTSSIIEHYPDVKGEYKRFREDTDKYKKVFFKKHNLTKVSQKGRNYPYWQRKLSTLLKHLKLENSINSYVHNKHLKKIGLNPKDYLKKKILFIVKNKNEASSRFRVFSYLNHLKKDFEVSFFYAEYKNEAIPKFLRSFIKRFRFLTLVYLVSKNDIIFMQRPMSTDGNYSTFFEWLLTRFNKNLIFDYDDAIFIENTRKMKSLVSLSNSCICGNDYLADFAKQYNPNTYIIPTPIDTHKFIPKESSTKESITIGWTGTSGNYAFFTPKLIQDLKDILKKYDNVDFLFICDRKPEKKFDFPYIFVKWNDTTEVNDLQQIDIGLMPLIDSAWTRGKCGFKLIQYGSISIPSVASDVGVNSKVILDEKSGFLVNEEEPNWTECLEKLINDQTLRESMGKTAREHIEKEYSVNKNYPKLKEVLENLN